MTALARSVCARVERLVALGAGLSAAFEQAASVLRERDPAFLFVQGYALDERLVLQVPEIARAAARIAKVTLRNHPKCADRG